MYKLIKYAVFLASLILCLFSAFVWADTDPHFLGCIPPTDEELAASPKLSNLMVPVVLPPVVDRTAEFPSPGSQGCQSSCTAWAVAYAYKSFQERVDNDWNISTTDHQFSPSYVYNQINNGVDQGSGIADAMNLIVYQGCCTLADMPYEQYDYQTQPNQYQKDQAYKYRASSWGVLGKGDVYSMKQRLAYGDAVVIGIPVYPDFDYISTSNPVYDNTDGTLRGWHAVCLIGYDDTMGAFKFINSWGTWLWGLSGYGYISYSLIQQVGAYAFVMTDASNPKTVTISATLPSQSNPFTITNSANSVYITYGGTSVGRTNWYVKVKQGSTTVWSSPTSFQWTYTANSSGFINGQGFATVHLPPGDYVIEAYGGTGTTGTGQVTATLKYANTGKLVRYVNQSGQIVTQKDTWAFYSWSGQLYNGYVSRNASLSIKGGIVNISGGKSATSGSFRVKANTLYNISCNGGYNTYPYGNVVNWPGYVDVFYTE